MRTDRQHALNTTCAKALRFSAVVLMLKILLSTLSPESLARSRTNGWLALPNAPRAERIEAINTHFGVSLPDEYAWLRSENWQQAIKDPAQLPRKIRAYIDAENRYARRSLSPTGPLQATLVTEMRSRLAANSSTVPRPDGGWEYFEKYTAGREHPDYYRRMRGESRAHLLLNTNRLSRGNPSFELAGVRHSPDHRYLAYAADTRGTEEYTLRFRDLVAGRDLPDKIEGTEELPVWASDSRTVLYTRRDDGKPLTVLRHTIGTPVAGDSIAYAEKDPRFLLTLRRTTSRHLLLIAADDSQANEIRALEASKPHDPPRLLIERREGERHEVEHNGQTLSTAL